MPVNGGTGNGDEQRSRTAGTGVEGQVADVPAGVARDAEDIDALEEVI
jgi:hypothetical protein